MLLRFLGMRWYGSSSGDFHEIWLLAGSFADPPVLGLGCFCEKSFSMRTYCYAMRIKGLVRARAEPGGVVVLPRCCLLICVLDAFPTQRTRDDINAWSGLLYTPPLLQYGGHYSMAWRGIQSVIAPTDAQAHRPRPKPTVESLTPRQPSRPVPERPNASNTIRRWTLITHSLLGWFRCGW